MIYDCFVLLVAFCWLFSGRFMTFLCNRNSPPSFFFFFLNHKYNVCKNKTSIPGKNMHLHIYVSARGSDLSLLVRTRIKLRDAHNPDLFSTGSSQPCPWCGSPQHSNTVHDPYEKGGGSCFPKGPVKSQAHGGHTPGRQQLARATCHSVP